MADRTGQQIGNYRLIKLLGSGGFAEVYLAQNIRVAALQVAIKVLHEQLAQNHVEEFLKEAHTIARLHHPNIVRILDVGVIPGENVPYLVMEYLRGGTLRDCYPKGSIVPLQNVVVYVQQVSAALQSAHYHKLIHRDIKPDNLLLDDTGKIVLSDFGIATVARGTSSLNTEGIFAGTVPYVPPEQIRGNARPASDQYALAITVYEWLTGSRPFTGTVNEILFQQIESAPPPLRSRVSTISPAVEAVVLKALEKEYHQRFPSVTEFARALAQAATQTQQSTTTLGKQKTTNREDLSKTQSAHYPFPVKTRTGPRDKTTVPPTQTPVPQRTQSQIQQPVPVPRHFPRRKVVIGLAVIGGLAVSGIGVTWWENTHQPSIKEARLLYTYTGNTGFVTSVAWLPDSTEIVSGGTDTSICTSV